MKTIFILCSFVNNLFMWESSVPITNDNPMFATTNQQLINSYGNITINKLNEQAFQTCRSIINRFNSNSSSDDQVFSDDDEDDDDDQGGITPKVSKKKGPHSLVLQLNIQNIHLAANAPMVILKTKLFIKIVDYLRVIKLQKNLEQILQISVNFVLMVKD